MSYRLRNLTSFNQNCTSRSLDLMISNSLLDQRLSKYCPSQICQLSGSTFGITRVEAKLSASSIGALMLAGISLLLEGRTWTWVCPNAKTAGGGDMQPSLTESKASSVSSAMVHTNPKITKNLGGAAKWTRRRTLHILRLRRVIHALTCSNALIVGVITRLTPTSAHSGGIDSTVNGTKKIHWDPWKQGQINLLFGERQVANMILKNLNILSQNICKNHLIVNTILETQSHFNIILIQELPWFVIHQVPSTANSKGKNFIGTVHHPNWILFITNPVNKATSLRVTAYINIHLFPLHFSLHLDIINHSDILLMSFTNDHIQYFIMNIYSDLSHLALKYLKDIEVNIDNVLVMTGDFNIRDSL